MSTPRYSLPDRWLHWLALEPAIVRHLSFDLEREYALPRRPTPGAASGTRDLAAGAVYVCGLARSGTTLLLRLFDQVDAFRSLSYRDMPFPLAPNLWRRFSSFSQKQAIAAERIHGDGVFVDFDSPEGFEEVFWRTFTRYDTRNGALSAAAPSRDALRTFADYRAMVANPRHGGDGVERRYLSKNNNNLLRLQALADDATGTLVLIHRDPIAAARSMHRTHVAFTAEQSGDAYMRRYMGWLGHYEFGIDHKPFAFALSALDRSLDPAQPDYWLSYWCAVHEHVLSIRGVALILVDYDALCATPAHVLATLFERLRVDADGTALAGEVVPPRQASSDGFDPALVLRAATIRQSLQGRPDHLTQGPR